MKIELALMIIRNDHVEASKAIVADNLALLPIPVPAIGEHIEIVVHGTLHCGLVTKKVFNLAEIDDYEEGVLRIGIFADEQS